MIGEPRNGNNRLLLTDRAAHDWYRFVLSFPPHLVQDYVQRFGLTGDQCILDPFCGTGTTLVECKKLGISSVGVEAHPMSAFASRVKVSWTVAPDGLLEHARTVARAATATLLSQGVDDDPLYTASGNNGAHLYDLPPERKQLLIDGSISPRPLHKVLVLLDSLEELCDQRYDDHERLALAKTIVASASNLHFGPEVGVGATKDDAAVVSAWLNEVASMARDLANLNELSGTPATVHNADARRILEYLEPASVDAVITSPPYPNEKDYTRTTRLESVLLGFIRTRDDLRVVKKGLIRSNTRGVYKEDCDDSWVAMYPEIQRISGEIEARRIELGKTSGFEKLYGRVTKLYFGGMARHLADLRAILRPGAQLAYVVGDQASYLRIMIRTGQLLTSIAASLGYEVVGIDLFRTRRATATRQELREEVVLLRWPG